jgi:hypothetical protein
MCVVHVQFCPSCQIYSPIMVLQPHENKNYYYTVYDRKCEHCYCSKARIVNTLWMPSMDWHLIDTCDVCKPIECYTVVIYRDCQRLFVACNKEKWMTRKIVTATSWARHYKLWDIC